MFLTVSEPYTAYFPIMQISSSPYINALPQSSISYSLCNRVTRAIRGVPGGTKYKETLLSTSDRPETPLRPSATHKKQHHAVCPGLHATLGTFLCTVQSNCTHISVCYHVLLSDFREPSSLLQPFTLGISVQSGQLLCFTDQFSAQSSL